MDRTISRKKATNHAYYKGQALEQLAADYLQNQGLQVLQRNFHCLFGEIDLICKDQKQNELIFIEVRYRKDLTYGTPAETITKFKQRKILLAVEHYLARNLWATNLSYRIDVIAITGRSVDLNIEWIQNAIYM